MKRLFLGIALVLSTNLLANEQEGNGRINYVINSDYLSVGLAAEFIARGYPLAQEQLLAEIVSPSINNIGELFEAKSQEYQEQTKTTLKLATLELAQEENPSSGTPAKLPDLHQLNLTQYFSCLEEVTPVFFKAFSIKHQDYLDESEKAKLLKNLNSKIHDARGVMGRSSLEGHICGKYLGKLGFLKLPDMTLYKYLTVIKSLENAEKTKVLAALIATQHPDSQMEDKVTFLKLFNYQLGRIHFKKLASFDVDEVKDHYHTLLAESTHSQEKGGVRITHTALNQWTKIEEAYNWAFRELKL